MVKTIELPPSGTNPWQWYQQASLQPDAAQAAVVRELEQLWLQLIEFKNKRNQFLGRSWLSPDVPKGMYLWGGVGRGKSMLMDVFFACVPYRRKRRVHFHHFMSEVHHEMKRLAEQKDPLMAVADNIEQHTRLLCLDEFHVDDIADAMILARLMEALFERGVVLVTTSNCAPDDLYPNGLQRQNFLPAIALIKQYLKVLQLDAQQDYRLSILRNHPQYLVAQPDSEARLDAMFEQMAAGEIVANVMSIDNRKILAKKMARNQVWLDFSEICGGAYAQEDYLLIANKFATVFLSNVPRLTVEQSAQARRFTWLVDLLYDHKIRLIASFAVEPESICPQEVNAGEFARTISRLIEMRHYHDQN